MPTTPRRRPLPARVYWARRTAVLVTVLALVFAVARLFLPHASSDAATTVARQTPATTPAASAPQTTGGPQPTPAATSAATPTPAAAPTLVAPTSVPTGACSDDEVKVTPAVATVTGGAEVALPLDLVTTTSHACTWKVSSSALVVKISRGQQKTWSSQDCPAAIGVQDVVVRPSGEQPTQVQVPWGGRRSVTGCAPGQAWVDPGRYTLTAASLGGNPAQAALQVVAPPRPTVTKTAKPKKQKTPTAAASTPAG